MTRGPMNIPRYIAWCVSVHVLEIVLRRPWEATRTRVVHAQHAARGWHQNLREGNWASLKVPQRKAYGALLWCSAPRRLPSRGPEAGVCANEI